MGSLIDRARLEIKLANYGIATASALSDPSLHPRVQDYRRQAAARMIALDQHDLRTRVTTAPYHVSRKIDGEFNVLVWRDGQALTLNPGGTVRAGLPWMDEAARLLAKGGVREAMVAGELYVARPDGRPRVHDVSTVARQPGSPRDLESLRFAVFDLMLVDGKPPADCFADTWKKIERLFGAGQAIHPVQSEMAKDCDGVEKLFRQWVEKEGAEGLVARSDTAGTFKIKRRQTLDVAVIGFTEGTDDRQGLLHDLLVAVMRADGTLQVLTRVGGGFGEEQRRTMLADLKDMIVDSEYAEVNGDHVAYQMVEPLWVIEISCLDLISQTTSGGPILRMSLDWNRQGSHRYHTVRRLPLASVISPQFLRRRDDKTVSPCDIRIKQVTDLVEVPMADRDARQVTLPPSEVLRREVYTKQMKGETMVRKFVLWKTNKESQGDEYPAFVIHYTDFSPNRKTPMEREIRVSRCREQIDALWDGLKTANLAKGWELRGAAVAPSAVAAPAPATVPTPPSAPVEALAAPEPEAKTAKKSGKKTAEPPAAACPVQEEPAPSPAAAQEVAQAAPAKKSSRKKKAEEPASDQESPPPAAEKESAKPAASEQAAKKSSRKKKAEEPASEQESSPPAAEKESAKPAASQRTAKKSSRKKDA